MKHRIAFGFAAGLLLVVLAAVWVTASPAITGPGDRPTQAADDGGSGILDGMTFAGRIGEAGGSETVADTFGFAMGRFVSVECDRRCGYPPRPYFVRQNGDKTEFVSEGHCLHKNARIVWRGTVGDGKIEGVFTWTVKRWYWTIEKEFHFAGTIQNGAGPLVTSQ